MAVKYAIRTSEYHDSVTLMQVARALNALPGVDDAAVVMATTYLDEAVGGLLGVAVGEQGPGDAGQHVPGASGRQPRGAGGVGQHAPVRARHQRCRALEQHRGAEPVEEGPDVRRARTGRDGAFRVEGLRAGAWRIRLRARAGPFRTRTRPPVQTTGSSLCTCGGSCTMPASLAAGRAARRRPRRGALRRGPSRPSPRAGPQPPTPPGRASCSPSWPGHTAPWSAV